MSWSRLSNVVYFLLPPAVVRLPTLRSPLRQHFAFPWRVGARLKVCMRPVHMLAECCLLAHIHKGKVWVVFQSCVDVEQDGWRWFSVMERGDITVSVQEESREAVGGGSPPLVLCTLHSDTAPTIIHSFFTLITTLYLSLLLGRFILKLNEANRIKTADFQLFKCYFV